MNVLSLVSSLPPEIATLLLAMTPSVELGGSIPVTLEVFRMPVPKAYLLSVVGSLIPAFFLIWLLGPLTGLLVEKFAWARRFFDWLFARTRNKFAGKYQRWGDLALVAFVSLPIPLPLSGLWTGSIAAFVFGIPKRRALFLLWIGAMIAGAVAVSVTLGVVNFVQVFL